MSILKNTLINLSGNRFIQNTLEKNVQISHYLMGIGSGGGVMSSGEKAVLSLLRKRISPFCIFDVGSNKGQYLQSILDNIHTNDFTIHCFEPGINTFKVLCSSLKKEDKRIKLNNIGIGKEKYESILYYDKSESGLASLTKRNLDHFNINFDKFERVKIDTIDNYCTENSIDYIHLLKMDIEGHELDALHGATNMFKKRSIDIITFEFGGCNIDTKTFFQDFWYFFKEYKFDIFRITPSGYLHPIKSYNEIHEQFRTVNFMATSTS